MYMYTESKYKRQMMKCSFYVYFHSRETRTPVYFQRNETGAEFVLIFKQIIVNYYKESNQSKRIFQVVISFR